MNDNPRKTLPPYLKSRIFKQIFLSYVFLILAFLFIYTGWYLYSYRESYMERTQEHYQTLTSRLGTAMDQQLLAAQSLCASINTSESCRSVLQTAYVEKKTIDSMQLFKLQNELTRIKTSSSNMNIYTLMLGFWGDSKLFLPRTVVSLSEKLAPLADYPIIRLSSVSRLLGASESSIVINKDFLIYADRYTGLGTNAPDKGVILILFEQNGLRSLIESAIPTAVGFDLVRDDQTLFSVGKTDGVLFSFASLVDERLTYQAYIPETVFHATFPLSSMIPLLLLLLLGAMFVVITYVISKRYYQPIGSIGEMIEHNVSNENEIEDILGGIRNLIGERNGYREKMITISPYAQQGMLHSMINGGLQNQQLQVLIDEQFVELKKPCYMLALVNLIHAGDTPAALYHDANELITHTCAELSTDEYSIVTVRRDMQNLYIIISGDDSSIMEELFYQLHQAINEALDDPAFAVTIGVSRCETDLERLQESCNDAEKALGSMLTGGRSSVYFYMDDDHAEKKPYYFPKDLQKRMLRDFKEGNLADLDSILEDIRRRNLVQADLMPAEIQMMVEELHLTVRSTLREAFDMSTTHINVARVPVPATIDEILSYYHNVFETVLNERVDPADEAGSVDLEKEVCTYIEANLYNPELSQNGIADRFGLSSKTIGLICKNHFGTTFLQYVRDRQIQHAVELLQTTDASLEQIAVQCGFTNLLTFRRNFKSVMNMNPSDFRK